MKKAELIFVYNADSSLFETVTDFAHKIFSPSTYRCRLCALTFGNFVMKKEWKQFIEQLPFEIIFLYKKEFIEKYNMDCALPAVFIKENESPQLFIGKDKINNCSTLQQLKQTLLSEISKYDKHHHSHL